MNLESKNKPLVSIIVRTKDRPHLLKRALNSILTQTYRPIEVILVNDFGEDVKNVKSQFESNLPIKYIDLPSVGGRAQAANIGLEKAEGKFISFLDDDDLFYKDHIERLAAVLIDSDFQVAYSDAITVWMRYNVKGGQPHELRRTSLKKEETTDFSYERLRLENYIPFNSILFRDKLLKESGGFDSSLSVFEDWDLLIRIGKIIPFYHLNSKTCEYFYWVREFDKSYEDSYRKIINKHFSDDLGAYVVDSWSLMYRRNLELNKDALRLYTNPFNRVLDFFLSLKQRLKA